MKIDHVLQYAIEPIKEALAQALRVEDDIKNIMRWWNEDLIKATERVIGLERALNLITQRIEQYEVNRKIDGGIR